MKGTEGHKDLKCGGYVQRVLCVCYLHALEGFLLLLSFWLFVSRNFLHTLQVAILLFVVLRANHLHSKDTLGVIPCSHYMTLGLIFKSPTALMSSQTMAPDQIQPGMCELFNDAR